MFFNQSQSRIVFLADHKADIVLYKRIYLAYTLLPAVMKLKTQIKIYHKLVSELGGKYDGAEDFINSRVKELCLEDEILEEEVRL